MKRVLSLVSVCLVFLLALSAGVSAQEKSANFAGTWVLDKSKSDLPQMMQNVEGITWIITQDDKQIARESKIEAGQGGGRGMMGGNRPVTYKLDGSETTNETPRGKSTSKVKWLDSGKILEVSTVSNITAQGSEYTMKTTEHWELAEGGKVLKAHQTRETPQGTVETKLVFNKKS